jgi:hypothetical protein
LESSSRTSLNLSSSIDRTTAWNTELTGLWSEDLRAPDLSFLG